MWENQSNMLMMPVKLKKNVMGIVEDNLVVQKAQSHNRIDNDFIWGFAFLLQYMTPRWLDERDEILGASDRKCSSTDLNKISTDVEGEKRNSTQ